MNEKMDNMLNRDEVDLHVANRRIHELTHTLVQKEQELLAEKNKVETLRFEAADIQNSIMWHMYNLLNNAISKIIPANSYRETIYKKIVTYVRTGIFWLYDTFFKIRGLLCAFVYMKYKPSVSVVVIVNDPTSENLAITMHTIYKQDYSNYNIHIIVYGTAEALTMQALEHAPFEKVTIHYIQDVDNETEVLQYASKVVNGEYVTFIDQYDILLPNSLSSIVMSLQKERYDILYSDYVSITGTGRADFVYEKVSYDKDLLLQHDYMSSLLCIRRELLIDCYKDVQNISPAGVYDLTLRAVEKTKSIFHIKKPIYGYRTADKNDKTNEMRLSAQDALTRRGIDTKISNGNYPNVLRLSYPSTLEPKISIIVPFKDNVHLLRDCIDSILDITEYPSYEIICIDHESTDPAVNDFLDSKIKEYSCIKVMNYTGKFNFSDMNNKAVDIATGSYVLFLNNDTKVINSSWLSEMVTEATRDSVGAVGALLLFADNTVQHAGVGVHVSNVTDALFRGSLLSDCQGDKALIHTARNVSVVTAACLLMSKEIFIEVGGFNTDKFAVSFNDVDICLKILELGKRIRYTPHARLYHFESYTRGHLGRFKKVKEEISEYTYLKQQHKDIFSNGDKHARDSYVI